MGMDRLQQRIVEIALQIPEYVGYQAKDRRRELDKLIRRQLASKYDQQRTYLQRIQRQAPLEYIVNLENLDQKLQRLIARLNTAPGGYAGWFDAGQIVEGDLDQLTQFDSELTDGVTTLKTAFDQIAQAVKAKEGVDDAVSACAEQLDTLNAEFDQREQFLAMGKRPSLTIPTAKPTASPLEALEQRAPVAEQLVTLANLKLNDAVSYGGTDYVISGKITYTIPAGSFWAYQLQDGSQKRWLRLGPNGDVAFCQQVTLAISAPFPNTVDLGETYTLQVSGNASISVEGAGGARKGTVNYARFTSPSGKRVWVEDFGTETRTMQGEAIDASAVTVYRR